MYDRNQCTHTPLEVTLQYAEGEEGGGINRNPDAMESTAHEQVSGQYTFWKAGLGC